MSEAIESVLWDGVVLREKRWSGDIHADSGGGVNVGITEDTMRRGGETIAHLRAELGNAREALDEWDNAAKHVETNHPDEVHCGCVPVLLKLLADARKECADAKGRLDFSRSWWAAREGRISQWIRDNKSALPEELVHQWFSIWANGTSNPAETPTYAGRLNLLEHQRDVAMSALSECADALEEILPDAEKSGIIIAKHRAVVDAARKIL